MTHTAPTPTGLIILPANREGEIRAWAQRHALSLALRPLEEFLPGEGTGSIVAIAGDAEARRMLGELAQG
ncbi:hypothetical protein ACFFMP_06520 [Pseudoroseomonas cervicalis]|uniref:Uncharacterized protein n=1 Tax=Pseudoroseomonas cervicalis ATCC 49957 TaxID=525371 RepID=D5RLK4_9PROT|nr:hypothetical protein [Pseudoroseomonas cervicalis]EFH11814.1 hypothetical protein HMPREF0731_1965 [Pseudoroseomonas cervicalis ATCC 49957]